MKTMKNYEQEIEELKSKLKAKDEECCFEECNKKAEKSLGNNLTPNLNMCKEHFDLFQKHTDAREDYFKRKKDEEFDKILGEIKNKIKLIENTKEEARLMISGLDIDEYIEEIKQRIKEE